MIPDHDFLALSRANEWQLEPFSFSLPHGDRVEVWDTGVLCLEPASPGAKALILSSGIHGNETAPIEICNDLLRRLLSGELRARHRTLFLFGNPAAMNLGVREVEENMNRLFSGAHSRGPGLCNRERMRAKRLEQYVARFYEGAGEVRCHYDLHTAIRGSRHEKFAVYPFLGEGREYSQEQVRFLGACGVRTFLLSESPTTTFSYFSAREFGAHGFTVELGKVRPFGENDMTRFIEAKLALEALVTRDQVPLEPWRADDFLFFRISRVINKRSEAFRFLFADDVENFTEFPRGFLLAEDGELRHQVEAEREAVVFPNAKVAVGQRTVLMVVPTRLWP
ncbi:succinylglutamate desuccinylase [Aeromonas schubertii]|uniref:succinylglutamate desuccinylase n=1 Tax=Aeromonas schubertii TaxID=652 RepID=UPI0010A7AA0E|nr:succinylglutamate desuccinylase [Aeromonas schubertii]MBZ6071597.1 succinylglutamate desuccinylase [Aeromonas schubertii]QCG48685.1 succinylglutamate desuccinylase [Aeromonas schubertii]